MKKSEICTKYSTGVVVLHYKEQLQSIEWQQIERSRSSKCSAEDRRERNRFRKLYLRKEGRNLNVGGEEELENSFRSELSSLKSLVAL